MSTMKSSMSLLSLTQHKSTKTTVDCASSCYRQATWRGGLLRPDLCCSHVQVGQDLGKPHSSVKISSCHKVYHADQFLVAALSAVAAGRPGWPNRWETLSRLLGFYLQLHFCIFLPESNAH